MYKEELLQTSPADSVWNGMFKSTKSWLPFVAWIWSAKGKKEHARTNSGKSTNLPQFVVPLPSLQIYLQTQLCCAATCGLSSLPSLQYRHYSISSVLLDDEGIFTFFSCIVCVSVFATVRRSVSWLNQERGTNGRLYVVFGLFVLNSANLSYFPRKGNEQFWVTMRKSARLQTRSTQPFSSTQGNRKRAATAYRDWKCLNLDKIELCLKTVKADKCIQTTKRVAGWPLENAKLNKTVLSSVVSQNVF